MKHVIHICAWCLTLCLSQQVMSQTGGILYTAEYKVSASNIQNVEKDAAGNPTKVIYIVPGNGKHSILGDVTTMSITDADISAGKAEVQFTQTDVDGNSLYIDGNLIQLEDGSLISYGIINGGTGKYKMASGNYQGKRLTEGDVSTWKAEGILYYTSEEQEIEAIKKVVAAETQAYVDKDFDAMDAAYVIAPFTTNITNVPVGTVNMVNRYKNGQPPVRDQKTIDSMIPLTDVVRSDWDIQLRGEVAWAVFNQKLNALGSRYTSVETRILEKLNGVWKIVYSSTFADHEGAVPLTSTTKK